jgi:branched-chain amino acid transport system ATP-binding protein
MAPRKPPVPSAEPLLLQVEDLTSAYGRVQALKGVSLDVRRGEIVCLLGGNGAGKTTLLRAVSGVQPVIGGRVRFAGEDMTRAPPHRRVAMGIAQVPEGRQIFGALAVEDNLRLGAYLRRDSGIAADVERVFAMFPVLKERRGTPGGALSGGQQQMRAIGRALMSRPRLLLLDEPSMGLAPLLVDQIFAAIQALKRDGVTVFLVEQNAAAALDIADRGYVIETGRIVHEGWARAMLADERLREAYLGV